VTRKVAPTAIGRDEACRNPRSNVTLPPIPFAAAALRAGAITPRRALNESDGATMTEWLKTNATTICAWAALIAVAAIVFGASRGTALGQFGIGLLTGAIALLVVIALFELIWRAAVRWLDSTDDKQAPGRARKHRERGQ
jgi:hypothetical protein